MQAPQHDFSVRLFYSYCHKDKRHRATMETTLEQLKRGGQLITWSDHSILPGESISEKVMEAMREADIFVFLVSWDFIASEACIDEWNQAKSLAGSGRPVTRIPVILRHCAWKELLGKEDILVLPKDGRPVVGSGRQDAAWHEVHAGIRAVIEKLRLNFKPKRKFLQEVEETDFLAAEPVSLSSIFVFPTLTDYWELGKDVLEPSVDVPHEVALLNSKLSLVHGDHMSGKTALARHLFLHLAKLKKPVLLMDLKSFAGRVDEGVLRRAYSEQFHGDYDQWIRQEDKTLIIDNLSQTAKHLDFLSLVREQFDRIIVTASSDVFHSYFRDERLLADFRKVQLGYMTHGLQEQLIRKRLHLSTGGASVPDGRVDHIEQKINSIIISNKIVPRYPFYILTILQTLEGFMPSDLTITAHGHCYYVLILAYLIKAGVQESDPDINACLNFAEHLAFSHYVRADRDAGSTIDFSAFIDQYRKSFHIDQRLISRMASPDYGIVRQDGQFRTRYMQYFFLGRHLAKPIAEHKEIIERMCDHVTLRSNYLTLLFVIHHTQDDNVVDEILLRTMTALDTLSPATLDKGETKRFERMMDSLPQNVLSNRTVEDERSVERKSRDVRESAGPAEEAETDDIEPSNDCYRILKCNQVLGQILRNKHGSLKKERLELIIESVADSGLRLVNAVLADEGEIEALARYLHTKHPEFDVIRLAKWLRQLSFIWTMVNLERVVSAVNHPELREMLEKVVSRKDTPAYELIDYFSRLDAMEQLTKEFVADLKALINKHRDPFLKGVLSIRTQWYMNTHRSDAPVEQSICSLLGVRYRHKLR